MAPGNGFTVTFADCEQPVEVNVKDMSVVPPPAEMPVTTPPEFTVPIAGDTLLHVPVPDASLSVMVEPVQTLNEPVPDVIGKGNGITFTVATAAQPVTGNA
jgi:hypothetical protein